jgi:hypothetical protein
VGMGERCKHSSTTQKAILNKIQSCENTAVQHKNKSERKPKAVKTHQYNTKLNLNKNESCGNTAVQRRNKFHSKATVQRVVLVCFHSFWFSFRFIFVLYCCVFTTLYFIQNCFLCCTAVLTSFTFYSDLFLLCTAVF